MNFPSIRCTASHQREERGRGGSFSRKRMQHCISLFLHHARMRCSLLNFLTDISRVRKALKDLRLATAKTLRKGNRLTTTVEISQSRMQARRVTRNWRQSHRTVVISKADKNIFYTLIRRYNICFQISLNKHHNQDLKDEVLSIQTASISVTMTWKTGWRQIRTPENLIFERLSSQMRGSSHLRSE